MQAIQNLGLAVISLVAGFIVDKYGYLWLEVFFISWLVLAFISSVTLLLFDSTWTNGYLNMTANKRKCYEKEIENQHEDLNNAGHSDISG